MDWDDTVPHIEDQAPRRTQVGRWSTHKCEKTPHTTQRDLARRMVKLVKKEQMANQDEEETRLQEPRWKRDSSMFPPEDTDISR